MPTIRTSVPSVRIRAVQLSNGPTLAVEKLCEDHEITVGRETLRLWMIADGLWLDRRQRRKRVHQPRYRRDCVGELVQVDGSEHWWFEDRGPQCTLLVFVDDATSRLMHLQFVESESTFAYFHAARAYLEAWGKPVAFYSDKRGVFRFRRGQNDPRPPHMLLGLLRSPTTATSRSRSAALTSISIPSRITHYRMRHPRVESYDYVVPLGRTKLSRGVRS
jgi:hypothetical protein